MGVYGSIWDCYRLHIIYGAVLGFFIAFFPIIHSTAAYSQLSRFGNDSPNNIKNQQNNITNKNTQASTLPFSEIQKPNILDPMKRHNLVDCNIEQCMALTFDDGPSNTTPQILDVLQKHQVRATFFVIGNRIASSADIVRRIYKENNEIGNHSWDHSNMTKMNPEQVRDQINRTQQAISDIGVLPPKYFRPPYGVRNQVLMDNVKLPIILWNIDPEDWRDKNVDKIAERIIEHSRPGAIILLHDLQESTAPATDKAIMVLKQHYKLVTITELLGIPPQERGEFFGRSR